MTTTKKMFEAIVLAQVASDAGKGIDDLAAILKQTARVRQAREKGYHVKDVYILDVLMNIRPCDDIHYFVTRDEKINSYLVYFDIRLSDGRYQVSFHCFNDKLKKFLSKRESSHWDKKSSRFACEKIAAYIGMLQE